MSVILNRHVGDVFCLLGDPTLTSSGYYPGIYTRPDGTAFSGGSKAYYTTYPTTSPDQIVRLIRPPTVFSGFPGAQVVTGSSGGLYYGTLTTGFPPTPFPGSPFFQDDRTGGALISGTSIYPRWSSETTYDLNTYPDTLSFTQQGIPTGCQFLYSANGLTGSSSALSMSYDSGPCANDPIYGGDATYAYQGNFSVLAYAAEVCCWNEGAQLELNLEIYAQDFTTSYVSGTFGNHDITLSGSPYYHSTLTQTVTIDASWMTQDIGIYHRIHVFDIPQVTGSFTFVNDFYISSVTAP